MAKSETWVQQYSPQIEPGPDGAPIKPSDIWVPTTFGLQFRDVRPYADRRTMRAIRGGRLTQHWRRYLVRDWSEWGYSG